MATRSAAPPTTADARLDELLCLYAALIRHVVTRVGGLVPDAVSDGIEQQAFIDLRRHVTHEQTIRHPTSYVYRAAVRETVRAVRQVAREHAARGTVRPAPPAATPDTAESRLSASERRASIAAALAGLAPDRRRAVQADLAGYEVEEIMLMFNWTYQRARNLIARGSADLRHALRAGGFHGS